MGQLDQIDHLCVGLKEETRQERYGFSSYLLRGLSSAPIVFLLQGTLTSHPRLPQETTAGKRLRSANVNGVFAEPEPISESPMTIFVEAEHAVSDVSAANLCVSTSEAAPGSTPLLFCDAVVEGHKLRMLVDLGASHCIGKPGNVVPFPVEQKVNITARGFDGKSESRVVCTGKLVVSVERCQSTQAPFLSG
ncbi:hypothetical protein PInf_004296 [Phytophthora infestans]|nr:hypothetical protein PInf_004296 [Phytophthora infestans]